MSWSFISDIHIKAPGDSREELLRKFFEKSHQINVEKIFLLGDIFDLMVGEKWKYLEYHRNVFKLIVDSKVKEIHFIEGNHDFHLQSLWKKLQIDNPSPPRLFYHSKGLLLEESQKKIWLSHGDDIELGNYIYKIYRFLIRSFVARLVFTRLLPLSLIKKIGGKASESGRYRHEKTYRERPEKEDWIRENFRNSATKIAQKKGASIVIAGHSHIKDLIQLDHCLYANNGYPPKTKCFGLVHNGSVSFQNLG